MTMKKIVLFFTLLFVSVSMLSIIDFSNNFSIEFNISQLDASDRVKIDTNYPQGLEITWSTGDTGCSIIIDTPGMYICSVKDIWPIFDIEGNFKYNIKPFVIRGIPDAVKIDTFIMDTVFEGENFQDFHTYILTDEGNFYLATFRDTLWTTETQTFYTETRAAYTGFWSGLLDTITISLVDKPLMLDAKILFLDDEYLKLRRWDVSY